MGNEGKHEGNNFTSCKARKLQYTSVNSVMNSVLPDVSTMMTEAQLKRCCTVFT
jgi:hypothetical protein